MSVAIAVDRAECRIKITGRFDFSSQLTFREALKQAPEGFDVTVDLQDTSYLDSAALGMLLVLREQAIKRGVRVVLTNCHGQAREVLELANFGRLFRIE